MADPLWYRWNGAVMVPHLDEYLQDALDAIEYANGPADSKWGALRAKAGHPAPFNLTYMEIGNENSGAGGIHGTTSLFRGATISAALGILPASLETCSMLPPASRLHPVVGLVPEKS